MSRYKKRRSSSPHDHIGYLDRFERNSFEGNRLDFEDFIECIKTAIINKCDEKGYRYIFQLIHEYMIL